MQGREFPSSFADGSRSTILHLVPPFLVVNLLIMSLLSPVWLLCQGDSVTSLSTTELTSGLQSLLLTLSSLHFIRLFIHAVFFEKPLCAQGFQGWAKMAAYGVTAQRKYTGHQSALWQGGSKQQRSHGQEHPVVKY